MKILFLSNLFPPNQIGGYEILCARVASLFAARGHDVHVLTSCYGKKISYIPGLEIRQGLRLLCGETIYQGFDKSETRWQVICDDNEIVAKNTIASIQPDIIFSWNLYGLSKSFFSALEKSDVPVVCMLTDIWLASMFSPEFVGHYMQNNVYAEGNNQTLHPPTGMQRLNCAAIFGASYMETLYQTAGLEFSSSEVIHNGVELDLCLTRPRMPRLKFVNGKQGPVKLLFAGRLVKIKGVHVAVQALSILKQNYKNKDYNVFLTIVGDDSDLDYIKQLREQIESLGITAEVEFKASIPERALPDLFEDHDIFLFPSLYEPFSLTLIHAMASGIPIIASDVGGNVEIVDNGQTGLLFPSSNALKLAEAINKLALDDNLREQISVSGRKAASHFTLTRMIDRMEDYLSRCAHL